MIITRHNYEEYFILYLDNELGAVERREVELFVQENTDLKEELDWLLQSRLVPDAALVFDNKDELMKTSGVEPIHSNNYEEWLLLYVDNELSVDQKTIVEKFAAGHPAVQGELALLQKTRLQIEPSLVFPDKEQLYRKEEKIRVITIQWRKIAVAAALLLAVSTVAFFEFNKNGDNIRGIASVDPTGIKPVPKNAADRPTDLPRNSNTIAAENNVNKTTKDKAIINNPVVSHEKRTIAPKERNILPSELTINEGAPVVAEINTIKNQTNDLPDPTHNPNVNRNIRQDNAATQADILSDRSLTNSTENIPPYNVTRGNSQSLNNVLTAASVESFDPTDAEPGKKNKLRGFFRKVTRTFEKATNIKATDDEDRLLLGGLAIKL